jgi:hypothetical protein
MDMNHGNAALASEWTCKMDMHAEQAAWTQCMSMLLGNYACPSCISVPNTVSILHVHAHILAAWTCSVDMQRGYAV